MPPAEGWPYELAGGAGAIEEFIGSNTPPCCCGGCDGTGVTWTRSNVPVEAGAIVVDAGAANAMGQKGASLLPGGVTTAEGDFRRGDMVELVLRDDAGERRIARGVSQYSAVDIRRIARRHSREIEGILGYTYGENVVHRDDLVLL